MEITLQLRCVLFCQFIVYFTMSELCYKCFSYNDIFFKTLGLRLLVVRLHYVWKKRYKWSCFCSSLWRIFITSQLDYLFVRCSYIFYDIRITLCFGTFELLMEITLQSRFVFVHHCDVFFITSQLRYLFVRCNNVFPWCLI